MKEFVWIAIQTWKRLLGVEVVVRLLRHFVQGRIAIAVGAPEGGVRVIWQAVAVGVEHVIVVLVI